MNKRNAILSEIDSIAENHPDVNVAPLYNAVQEALPLGCYDCGLEYNSEGWIETSIPDKVWARISPNGYKDGGILCITCIARRLAEAGYYDVPIWLCGTEPLRAMEGNQRNRLEILREWDVYDQQEDKGKYRSNAEEREPVTMQQILEEETSKERLSRIVAGCIKTTKDAHGEILNGSLAKRISHQIHGSIQDRIQQEVAQVCECDPEEGCIGHVL